MKRNIIKTILLLSILISLLSINAKALTFDQKIGMNGHVDVPKDILYAGGVVREYHNFGWTITENKQMYFDRFSYWDFDGYYKSLFERGITVMPCIQMGEQKIFNRDRNQKPVMLGDDTTDPMSYKIHANYLYNYAARYGHTVVPKEKLNLDPKASYKSGLGYITYFEDWNEPDKTWLGPDAQFNSTELAAMLSADYDGHNGRLGDTYGVKQADPQSKLVMGGMAGGSTMTKWLDEILDWSKANRTDKQLPLDVINYHQYTGTHSPENSTFVEDAKKVINWRNKNAPGKEIWISEFGWDTNLGSTKHAAPSEDAQRDWIIREYLIGDRIGLDRMTVYDALNDGPSSDATQYSTSGLATKGSEGFVKKSSWYGVNTAKNVLSGYTFDGVEKEEDDIYIYRYKKGDNIILAIWSPTENGTKLHSYPLVTGYSKGKMTVMKKGYDLGITTDLELDPEHGFTEIEVTESPIFIQLSDKIRTAPASEVPSSNNDTTPTTDNNPQQEVVNNNEEKKSIINTIKEVVAVPSTGKSIISITIIGISFILLGIIRLKKECK